MFFNTFYKINLLKNFNLNSVQQKLFDDKYLNIINIENGELNYIENFFDDENSNYFFKKLIKQIKWRQDFINISNKSIRIPRLTAWYGDQYKSYSYSGINMDPKPFTKDLVQIKNKIEKKLKHSFNSVLINYYRSGQDSVSWHSDDEKELGMNPVIASVSFGAARHFKLRNKKNHKLFHRFILNHGSLFVMKGSTQKFWEHEVPKTKRDVLPRINLTFRYIK